MLHFHIHLCFVLFFSWLFFSLCFYFCCYCCSSVAFPMTKSSTFYSTMPLIFLNFIFYYYIYFFSFNKKTVFFWFYFCKKFFRSQPDSTLRFYSSLFFIYFYVPHVFVRYKIFLFNSILYLICLILQMSDIVFTLICCFILASVSIILFLFYSYKNSHGNLFYRI